MLTQGKQECGLGAWGWGVSRPQWVGVEAKRSPKGAGNWCWILPELPEKIQDACI